MSHVENGVLLPNDEHNRVLVENVHPSNWINPQPSGRYNIVVLGAGTAGLVTAVIAAGLGANFLASSSALAREMLMFMTNSLMR